MMGFSATKYQREKQQRPWKINPVWRGIGCALLILVPILSWYGTTIFLESNQKVPLPWELSRVVTVPYTKIAAIDGVIGSINRYFTATNLLWGQIFFTIIFSFIGFGIMAFLYAMMYRVAGPPRYGPFDVPPNKV